MMITQIPWFSAANCFIVVSVETGYIFFYYRFRYVLKHSLGVVLESLYSYITVALSLLPKFILLAQQCSMLSGLPVKYRTNQTLSPQRLSSHFLLSTCHIHTFLPVYRVTFSLPSFRKYLLSSYV